MPVDFQSSLASLLRSFAMVASAVQLAKRALVSLLLTLAQQYSVQIQLKREDDDNLVEAAFRKVVKKTHPDKGGKLADQQRLQSTRERWRALKTARPTDRARPKVSSDLLPVQVAEPSSSKPYFIMSSSVLLTYHNVEASAWDSFIDFLQGRLLFWGVLQWKSVSLEGRTFTSCFSSSPLQRSDKPMTLLLVTAAQMHPAVIFVVKVCAANNCSGPLTGASFTCMRTSMAPYA